MHVGGYASKTQREAILSPGHSGSQGGEQVEEAGPQVGATDRPPGLQAQTRAEGGGGSG